ncbi:cysteine proteinase RD21a-like [Tripterygium wilfordii]|uniref:Cysteine proteinase RD21a-like n=1 Tax=Tripterygium wilfordii TaxID=458696 RepID=A0A7J7DGU8_TRIWF|nr:cysteine proteinase RD21a-like [Tripterygium wilfordii]
MAFLKSVALFLFFVFLGFSSALDMSIIDYDVKHGIGVAGGRNEAQMRRIYESWLVLHRPFYLAALSISIHHPNVSLGIGIGSN